MAFTALVIPVSLSNRYRPISRVVASNRGIHLQLARKVNGIADDRSVGVYVSNEQSPVYFQTLNVRTSMNPLALQKSIAAAIHAVSKDQALTDNRTVDQIKELSMANNRLQSIVCSQSC